MGLGLAGVGLSGVGLAWFTAWTLNAPARPQGEYGFTPFEVRAPHEDVEFQATDGVRLRGWWLEDPEASRVVVCCHGHRGSKADLLGIGPGLWRAGNTVLLFDFRGRGDSDNGPQSLAHNEQRDLEGALAYVRDRCPRSQVGVLGFSMGASVAALVAARDSGIDAVVLDSPFASVHDLITWSYRRYHIPSRPFVGLADSASRIGYGYGFGAVRPIDAIADIAPRPLLLMHGTDDRVIPVSHAQQLYGAAGEPKQFVAFDGAGHCGGYFQDRPGYIARVAEFFATLPSIATRS